MAILLNGREVCDIEVDGVDTRDYPDFSDAYISSAIWADTGHALTDEELDQLPEDLIYELAIDYCQCRSDYCYND